MRSQSSSQVRSGQVDHYLAVKENIRLGFAGYFRKLESARCHVAEGCAGTNLDEPLHSVCEQIVLRLNPAHGRRKLVPGVRQERREKEGECVIVLLLV